MALTGFSIGAATGAGKSGALHGDRYWGDTPLVHCQRFPAGTDVTD